MSKGQVKALSRSAHHSMSKKNEESLQILTGLGVAGDAHMGEKVKHRSRVAKNPNQPNLRQVHLIHSELHSELLQKGFDIKAGEMGENITTEGIALLALPRNSILHIGAQVKIQVTGLRNPCDQLNGLQEGLMKAVLDKDKEGNLIRKAGIMGIVIQGGEIILGDPIEVSYPPKPYQALERV